MTNTEATSIDLEVLERVSLNLIRANLADDGMAISDAVDEFSYTVNAAEVMSLVAAVKAALRVVGNPSRTPYTPPTSELINKEHAGPMNDLAEALRPFTVTK